MSITIEEGKYYRSRAGGKVGPMERRRDRWAADGWPYTYHDDGAWLNDGSKDRIDLVAEWVEPAPAPDVTKALAEALKKSRVYVGMVRSSDIADDDPIFGVMDEIDAALALYREGRS
jgi:hypothetical protein